MVSCSQQQLHGQEHKMELYLALICLATLSGSLAKSLSEECISQNTYDYEYQKFYSVDILPNKGNVNSEDFFYFEFYVKAASDAHILLADSDSLDFMSAYEIVIGAGKNSFSQIRLLPKRTKATQPTKDIVSAVDFKKFWIKLTNLGHIMVGKEGSSYPFLFWINIKPFPILYFAFSTWTNVKGEWYFNCKDSSASGSDYMEGEGNITAIHRLKNDLLTMYNPTIIPQREGYPEETIEVHLDANYFHLDERRGELTVNGMAHVKWTDWKLAWNPDEYEGIRDMYVTPFQIWTPGIRVMNSLASEKKILLSLSGAVAVTSKGDVNWRAPFHSVTLCTLGYWNWPFDMHNCTLVFGFWTEPLKINIKDVGVTKIAKSEWEIQKINGRETLISHVEEFGGIVDIFFRRRDPSYEFLLLPPFLGAAVLTLASFWLYARHSAKLFLNCGTILLLVLMLMSVGERIPAAVSDSPKIVLLYSWSVLVMCVPIVLFIALKYIPPCIHFPRILSSILNSTLVEILFFLPESSESQLSYSHLREQEEGSISAVRLVTLIERIVFLVYFAAMIIPFICFVTKFEMFDF